MAISVELQVSGANSPASKNAIELGISTEVPVEATWTCRWELMRGAMASLLARSELQAGISAGVATACERQQAVGASRSHPSELVRSASRGRSTVVAWELSCAAGAGAPWEAPTFSPRPLLLPQEHTYILHSDRPGRNEFLIAPAGEHSAATAWIYGVQQAKAAPQEIIGEAVALAARIVPLEFILVGITHALAATLEALRDISTNVASPLDLLTTSATAHTADAERTIPVLTAHTGSLEQGIPVGSEREHLWESTVAMRKALTVPCESHNALEEAQLDHCEVLSARQYDRSAAQEDLSEPVQTQTPIHEQLSGPRGSRSAPEESIQAIQLVAESPLEHNATLLAQPQMEAEHACSSQHESAARHENLILPTQDKTLRLEAILTGEKSHAPTAEALGSSEHAIAPSSEKLTQARRDTTAAKELLTCLAQYAESVYTVLAGLQKATAADHEVLGQALAIAERTAWEEWLSRQISSLLTPPWEELSSHAEESPGESEHLAPADQVQLSRRENLSSTTNESADLWEAIQGLLQEISGYSETLTWRIAELAGIKELLSPAKTQQVGITEHTYQPSASASGSTEYRASPSHASQPWGEWTQPLTAHSSAPDEQGTQALSAHEAIIEQLRGLWREWLTLEEALKSQSFPRDAHAEHISASFAHQKMLPHERLYTPEPQSSLAIWEQLKTIQDITLIRLELLQLLIALAIERLIPYEKIRSKAHTRELGYDVLKKLRTVRKIIQELCGPVAGQLANQRDRAAAQAKKTTARGEKSLQEAAVTKNTHEAAAGRTITQADSQRPSTHAGGGKS